jgi:signal transduction histidine kinase
MKRRSIKVRVTLWYTSFIVALLLLTAGVLFLATRSMSRQQLKEELINSVTDMVGEVHFHYGEAETDKLDFYRSGVSLFIYDEQGYLIAPKVNLGVQVDAILEDQTMKTVNQNGGSWLVYDLYATEDSTGFWVRGLCSLTDAGRVSGQLWLVFLIVLPAVALAAAWGGWRITRRAFFPVEQMAKTADAIFTGADLSQRIPLSEGEDELKHLEVTLNGMLSRLQRSFERERQFTSDVSHELKTPLAVIRSQCEYALLPQTGCDEKTEAVKSILQQCAHMSSVVSQLLLLAKGENGTFKPRLERLELGEMWEAVCMDMEEQAKKEGISLSWNLEPELYVNGDETLLIRLLMNLITNAIRYNRPGGRIEVSLSRQENTAVLKVTDTGIGIAQDQIEHIWERFYRGDSSRSGDSSGLGLSMVRWIAKLHKGTVSVESIEGLGSTFTVTLPLDS